MYDHIFDHADIFMRDIPSGATPNVIHDDVDEVGEGHPELGERLGGPLVWERCQRPIYN